MQNTEGLMKISEKQYAKMPPRLQELFSRLPNPGSDEVLRCFPETSSGNLTGQPRVENKIYNSAGSTIGTPRYWKGDSGSAARFFYCAKASRSERNAGLEGEHIYKQEEMSPQEKTLTRVRKDGTIGVNPYLGKTAPAQNNHPTVKPIALMEYLCTLTATPDGGVVLDPFMGSGTTGIACVNTGREFIGIEQSEEYFEIAKRRIEHWQDKLSVDLPLLELIEDNCD